MYWQECQICHLWKLQKNSIDSVQVYRSIHTKVTKKES